MKCFYVNILNLQKKETFIYYSLVFPAINYKILDSRNQLNCANSCREFLEAS